MTSALPPFADVMSYDAQLEEAPKKKKQEYPLAPGVREYVVIPEAVELNTTVEMELRRQVGVQNLGSKFEGFCLSKMASLNFCISAFWKLGLCD